MRADLLEAQATIDWVFGQLPAFYRRLETWFDDNVVVEIRDVPPPATHNPIVAVEKNLLPIDFSVEAGAYVNTIRSSLDILAMALVRRHGLTIPENRVYFPIADSDEAFSRKGGALLLQQLPADDREKLQSLKPYRGGNSALWALHHLDIVRKHRRLLDVQIRPIHLSMAGSLKPGDFEPLHSEPFQAGAETVLGLIRKGVPGPAMQSSFYVAINEPGTIQRRPVTAILANLGDAASAAIKLFDDQRGATMAIERIEHRQYPSFVECIFCGAASEVDLTDEHIVPFALGGNAVILKASCKRCAAETS